MSLNFEIVCICLIKKIHVFLCHIKKIHVFICRLILNDVYIPAKFPDESLALRHVVVSTYLLFRLICYYSCNEKN